MTKPTGFGRRKSFKVLTSAAQTNYQIKTLLYKTSGTDSGSTVYLGNLICDSTFVDVRFTTSDGSTLLDHYIDRTDTLDYVQGKSCIAWVELSAIPAKATASGTYYIYYSNAGATDAINGYNTFRLFDHFDSAALNSGAGGRWSVSRLGAGTSTYGTWKVSSSYLRERVVANAGVADAHRIIYVKSQTSTARPLGVHIKWRNAKHDATWQGFVPIVVIMDHTAATSAIGMEYDTNAHKHKWRYGGTWDTKASGALNDTNWHKTTFLMEAAATYRVWGWLDGVCKMVSATTGLAIAGDTRLGMGTYNDGTSGITDFDYVYTTNFTFPSPRFTSWGAISTIPTKPKRSWGYIVG